MLYFRVFLFLIIRQDEFAMFRRELFDTTVEASIFQFGFRVFSLWLRLNRRRLPPQIFEMDFIRHTVKVTCGLADKTRLNLGNLAGDPVDRLIRQVFGFRTAAAGEYLDEPEANSLVLQCRRVAIRIKPSEQRVEVFLCKNPVFLHWRQAQRLGGND